MKIKVNDELEISYLDGTKKIKITGITKCPDGMIFIYVRDNAGYSDVFSPDGLKERLGKRQNLIELEI